MGPQGELPERVFCGSLTVFATGSDTVEPWRVGRNSGNHRRMSAAENVKSPVRVGCCRMYVGISRAKSLLVIVGRVGTCAAFNETGNQ